MQVRAETAALKKRNSTRRRLASVLALLEVIGVINLNTVHYYILSGPLFGPSLGLGPLIDHGLRQK